MVDAPTVIVAGMHRSGTSLVASFLSALGIEMGEELLAGDAFNQQGYYEDTSFLELNSRILLASTRDGDGGHRDWGWTESESIDLSVLPQFQRQAADLVRSRAAAGQPWGWKDPRNTLLLDFWDRIVDRAVYILVYRFPWEVADSMQRLGADVFLRHPEYALSIWSLYNRHLLDFYRAHADRCLLISVPALVGQIDTLAVLLRQKLDFPVVETESLAERFRPELFTHLGREDPLISLYSAAYPEVTELLEDLDTRADLSSQGLWSPAPARLGVRLHSDRRKEATLPDLSVVIPCFDHGDWLLEAVASVERSAATVNELIIVDDGSRQPRTLGILETLEELGYKVIRQQNAGLSAARNRGIAEISGSLILPLDADNRLRPGFAEAAVSILGESPEVGVVYGHRWEFGGRSGLVVVPEFDLARLLRANFIDACAVFRKALWEEAGGYDQKTSPWEDWDFWITAAEKGWHFRRLPGPAFDYRVRPDSLVSSTRQRAVRENLISYITQKHSDLYREHLPRVLLDAESEVTELPLRLADLDAKARVMEELTAYARNLEAQIRKTQQQQSTLETHIAEVERQFAEKGAALDDGAAYVETLLQRLASVEQYTRQLESVVADRGTTLETHFAEVEKQLADKGAALDDAAAYVETLLQRLASVEQYTRQLESVVAERRTTLETYVAEVERQLADKGAALDDAAAYVETLLQRLASVEQYTRQLESVVADRGTTLADAAAHVETLQSHQKSVEQYLRTLEAELADRQTAIAEGAAYCRGLEQENRRLESESTVLAGRAVGLEKQSAELRAELIELEKAIERRDAELDRIQGSLGWRLLSLLRVTPRGT